MGRCKYCDENAGFLAKYHKKCQQARSDAWRNLLYEIETAIVEGSDLGTLKSKIISTCKSSFIDSYEIKDLMSMGFSNAVKRFLEDGVLSREEEEFATLFKSHFNLTSEDLNYNDAFNTMVKASVLRDVINGTYTDGMEQLEWIAPFNFQDEEKLIWLFNDVKYYDNCTRAQQRGGFSGLYIKLDNGVYYRKSSFSRRVLNTDEMIFKDTGSVGITSWQVYFLGENYFSVEIPQLMGWFGYEDGLSIKTTGMDTSSHVFKNVDGWFCFNLLANLISKL